MSTKIKEPKNILWKTKCYLSGGMQYVKDGRTWRETIKKELESRNITFFDPYYKPFDTSTSEDEPSRKELLHWMETEQYDIVTHQVKKFRREDLRLVDLSDWMLCLISTTVPSWGTAEELGVAVKERKPVFVIVDDPKGKRACPLWIMSMVQHKYIYNNIEETIETIKLIDDGKIKLDSDRWKLLKREFR